LRRKPEPYDREREPDVGQQHAMSVLASRPRRGRDQPNGFSSALGP
jgi:hypothetical protein